MVETGGMALFGKSRTLMEATIVLGVGRGNCYYLCSSWRTTPTFCGTNALPVSHSSATPQAPNVASWSSITPSPIKIILFPGFRHPGNQMSSLASHTRHTLVTHKFKPDRRDSRLEGSFVLVSA